MKELIIFDNTTSQMSFDPTNLIVIGKQRDNTIVLAPVLVSSFDV